MSEENKELPMAETVAANALYEIANLVYAILVKDVAEGRTVGRLRDEAREALRTGAVIVDKENDKMYRYPENAIKGAILLGEIKYGISNKTDLTQNDVDEMCIELGTLLPYDYEALVEHIKIK